jgi:NADPH2:quinone reductase
MKAVYIEATGSPNVIQYGDLPEPTCGPNQVMIEVAAVSVNPIDTYIRNGANFWELPKPYIIGCDFAGTVVEVGNEVRGFQKGQRVWGSNQGLMGRQGTFAERISVDSKWVYPAPENVPDRDLAAIALVGITAHIGLFSKAQLQPGETIFVRGGTGGVGAMVLQIAKAMNATVITTAGDSRKAERCKELGADHVINYRFQDVTEELKKLAPNGLDVYWETLRDPDFDQAVQAMAMGGRIIVMAGRDARPAFPVGPFYVKGCSMHGFAMFNEPPEKQSVAASDLNHWLRTGALRAQIDRVLPFSEARQAHELQESNTIKKSGALAGKLVLVP